MNERQCALDVETTGLNFSPPKTTGSSSLKKKAGFSAKAGGRAQEAAFRPHRVIEVAVCEIINRRVTGRHYHTYVNPERDIDEGAQRVHGITRDFLRDKPVFSQIVQPLLDFIQEDELIIHNAPFDLGFLNFELQLFRKKHPPLDRVRSIVDTLILARKQYPGQKNNLDALCRRLNVDNASRELHGALLDARLLSQVYLLMTGGQEQLFQAEVERVNEPQSESGLSCFNKNRPSLKVVHASPEELKAHAQFLGKFFNTRI